MKVKLLGVTPARPRALTVLVAAFAGAVVAAPIAQASPPPGYNDPHIPNMTMGNCPGGKGGFGSMSYCDGERYGDGSYWHQLMMINGWIGPTITMNCVLDEGGLIPPVAPAGACDGGWDGQTDTGLPQPAPGGQDQAPAGDQPAADQPPAEPEQQPQPNG